jgi:hypothetical protein
MSRIGPGRNPGNSIELNSKAARSKGAVESGRVRMSRKASIVPIEYQIVPPFQYPLAVLAVLLGFSLASSQSWSVLSPRQTPFEIRGAAADPLRAGRYFTWGDALHIWENGRPRRLAGVRHGFDPGGCAFDADGDGLTDLILARRSPSSPLGDLVLLRAPEFRPVPLDTGVQLLDCLPATLFGRRGFLMIHRHSQVRFYQVPTKPQATWPVREIYSIYTPSRQSGLAIGDVDDDGLPDIYCGNYWIQSPAEFDLPWRLFAINAHYAEPQDASFVLAASPGLLYAAQSQYTGTPLRLFRRPADPRQLWPEVPAAGPLLNKPSAMLLHDGLLFAAGEDGLRAYRPDGTPHASWPGPPVRKLIAAGDGIVALGAHFVSVWRK